MTEAEAWLEPRTAGAPESLRGRMLAALRNVPQAAGVADSLAAAALACLQDALRDPADRAHALDLLAADALFTHACEAAAADGSAALEQFARAWDATRFTQLLSADAHD